MFLVLGEMIRHPRNLGMHSPSAKLLASNNLSSGRLHKWRASQEDSAITLDNDVLIGHGWHVGATSSTTAKHH